ncbi:general secretory pathway protein GspE [Geomonas limicola]|uniref:General secretory pathway protein GspE n=1 Tax=Geomonas limicola TaxID=2740186 RepID=A0A6V8N5Y1_9BACT|nr:pilus assembly protein PilB [Geomonas limicola]GFO67810.1 general secretory pathway protein GspE [Geomonas limicola]
MNGLVKEGSIGAVLFKSQIITEQELKAALEEQKVSGCRVGEALVRQGVVTQEDIDWALAHQLNIPYVRLRKDNLDAAAVERVPAALARRYQLFPVFLSGNELSVAMADPLNQEAIEALGRVTGCQIGISVGLIREIREMQELAYGPDQGGSDLGFSSALFPAKVIEAINADLSCALLLNHLLLRIVQQKYASLSLQPLGDRVLLVARNAGQTNEVGRLELTYYANLTQRIRKLAKLPGEPGLACSGLLSFLWQGKRIPFQALLLGGDGGDYVTLKLQLSAPRLEVLADLQLSPSKFRDLEELVQAPDGLLLIAQRDPEERCRLIDLVLDSCDTGGKSVLLVGERLGRGKKVFPRIPAGSGATDGVAGTVAALLEHDPDLLVLDDASETAAFISASKAVLRGKKVLAGLAHGSKGGVLKQLLYLHQKNFLVPSQLKGVLSCKGVQLLCPSCKERYQPTAEELAALRLPPHRGDYYRPHGCPECDFTGYSGRRYLVDVIRFDAAFLEIFETIRKSADIISYMKDNGYRGITEEGAQLLERGEISPGEYVASILL